MTENTLLNEQLNLQDRFPEFISEDERKGYDGYVVKPENLIEFATSLRDEYGFDFLSSLQALIICPRIRWKSYTMPIRVLVAQN